MIARRIRKPATTATTARMMLSVDPTGDPESPTRGRRAPRSEDSPDESSGASVMRVLSLLGHGARPLRRPATANRSRALAADRVHAE